MISEFTKKQIIKEYIENKISQKELSRKYGLHHSTISVLFKKNGIETKYWKKDKLDKKLILEMYIDKKMSVPKIKKIIGISSHHPIYQLLRKEGVVRSMSDCHRGQLAWNKGKSWSEEIRKKLSKARKGRFTGVDNPNWQGGKIRTSEDKNRYSLDYKLWRREVKKRDDYKCMECGNTEKLHSHHIKPVRNVKDLPLLTDLNNGITLCQKCHRKTYSREKEFEIFYKGLLAKAVNSGKAQTD